jgi:ABC-2 type transport system permease protein
MSTATATGPASLDLSGTPSIGFGRLVQVELRKFFDTRASRWLLIAIAAITAAIVVIFFFAAPDDERTFGNFLNAAGGLQSYLLPVLGIMLVTSEWTQRTALTTFTLVPSRSRVIWAKVAASVIVGLAAVLLAFAIAGAAAALADAPDAFGGLGVDDLGKFGLLETLGVLEGLAFGLLFLNSAAAIVTYLVLPIAFSIVTNIWSALRDAAPWIDLSTAQQSLTVGSHVSGTEWAHLASAASIWVLLPFVVGLVRVLRAEVK